MFQVRGRGVENTLRWEKVLVVLEETEAGWFSRSFKLKGSKARNEVKDHVI